jgi:hypothetical protein
MGERVLHAANGILVIFEELTGGIIFDHNGLTADSVLRKMVSFSTPYQTTI